MTQHLWRRGRLSAQRLYHSAVGGQSGFMRAPQLSAFAPRISPGKGVAHSTHPALRITQHPSVGQFLEMPSYYVEGNTCQALHEGASTDLNAPTVGPRWVDPLRRAAAAAPA
jgi:hypothetical protein